MKRFIIILCFLQALTLQAGTFRAGLEGSLGTAIGTGKGYWDWMDPSQDIQRIIIPSMSLSLTALTDIGPYFQMEGGIGYAWNTCKVKNGEEAYTFRQNALEIPLGLKLFFNTDRRNVYIKGGPVFFLLQDNGSFTGGPSGENMIASPPDNVFHTGIQLGVGYQKESSGHLWQGEIRYLTFYSSPDYTRIDGSTGDIRYHRMQMTISFFL